MRQGTGLAKSLDMRIIILSIAVMFLSSCGLLIEGQLKTRDGQPLEIKETWIGFIPSTAKVPSGPVNIQFWHNRVRGTSNISIFNKNGVKLAGISGPAKVMNYQQANMSLKASDINQNFDVQMITKTDPPVITRERRNIQCNYTCLEEREVETKNRFGWKVKKNVTDLWFDCKGHQDVLMEKSTVNKRYSVFLRHVSNRNKDATLKSEIKPFVREKIIQKYEKCQAYKIKW